MLWWCHCGIDRQWRESQSSWSSRGCPHLTQILCVTPLPQFTVCPVLLQTDPSTPFPSPFFLLSPRLTPTPDKQGTLIIPFTIINLCCFHTMGPEESCRQQRKHLLLSRQGTNSRILEAVSYMPSVENTRRHMHTHAYTTRMQTCRRLLPPLSRCFLACITCVICKSTPVSAACQEAN